MNIFKLISNRIIMQRFMNLFETESTFYEHFYATFYEHFKLISNFFIMQLKKHE